MLALGILIFAAVVLTCTMFATKQSLLGFPCAIFWAIGGAQSYTLSTIPWGDWEYYLFFASALGMTVFTALAAFGLREKRDAIGEESMEKGEGDYIDEGKGEDDTTFHSGKESEEDEEDSYGDTFDTGDEEAPPSKRSKELRERATKRRSGSTKSKKANWGDLE